MKELSIEEKAKRYDEAIELAKDSFNYPDYPGFIRADVVFPELKESEDEKIRKSLIDMLKNDEKCYLKEIAWLEKQGKKEWSKEMGSLCLEACSLLRAYSEEIPYNSPLGQKIKRVEAFLGDLYHEAFYPSTYNPRPDIISPEWSDKDETIIKIMCNEGNLKPSEIQWLSNLCYRVKQQKPDNKIEPKFKIEEGKWYVCISQFGNCIEGRVYKATSYSRIMDDFGTEYDMHSDAYKYFRLWTIQDAKDGDVLYTSSTASHETFIFKGIDENGNAKCHFAYDSEDGFREGKYHFIGSATKCKPATKEQRDTLFAKMKKAGYEWDAEKKELKKIEDESYWGKEDKEMINNIIDYMTPMPIFFESTNGKSGKEYTQEFVKNATNWLESLKEKVQRPRQEWNEKDSLYYDDISEILINLLHSETANINKDAVQKDLDWLKSLIPKSHWKPTNEQISMVTRVCNNLHMKNSDDAKGMNKLLSQLERLYLNSPEIEKKKVWKPSEGQIIALRWVLNNVPYNKHKEEISGLLDQIKDL